MSLLAKIKNWIGRGDEAKPEPVVMNGPGAVVVPLRPLVPAGPPRQGFPMEMTDENIVRLFDNGVCLTCGAEDMFYEGPSGGASQNFLCGCCGQELNMLLVQKKALWGQDIGYNLGLRRRYEEEGRSIRDRHSS